VECVAPLHRDPQTTAGAPAIERYRVKDEGLPIRSSCLRLELSSPSGQADRWSRSQDGFAA